MHLPLFERTLHLLQLLLLLYELLTASLQLPYLSHHSILRSLEQVGKSHGKLNFEKDPHLFLSRCVPERRSAGGQAKLAAFDWIIASVSEQRRSTSLFSSRMACNLSRMTVHALLVLLYTWCLSDGPRTLSFKQLPVTVGFTAEMAHRHSWSRGIGAVASNVMKQHGASKLLVHTTEANSCYIRLKQTHDSYKACMLHCVLGAGRLWLLAQIALEYRGELNFSSSQNSHAGSR